jgi:hypothetical protein
MATRKTSTSRTTTLLVTSAMRRAGANVIEGTPELYPEDLAELVFRAMAAMHPRRPATRPRVSASPTPHVRRPKAEIALRPPR